MDRLVLLLVGMGKGPAQVLMFFVVRENNEPSMRGASDGTGEHGRLSFGAVFQPLLGALLSTCPGGHIRGRCQTEREFLGNERSEPQRSC